MAATIKPIANTTKEMRMGAGGLPAPEREEELPGKVFPEPPGICPVKPPGICMLSRKEPELLVPSEGECLLPMLGNWEPSPMLGI